MKLKKNEWTRIEVKITLKNGWVFFKKILRARKFKLREIPKKRITLENFTKKEIRPENSKISN